jgi:hypothetical protein
MSPPPGRIASILADVRSGPLDDDIGLSRDRGSFCRVVDVVRQGRAPRAA